MAKKIEQNKIDKNQTGLSLEHNVAYDDSLLPPAEELRQLKAIEETAVSWIMKRTEIEQDARIKFNFKRLGMAKKEINLSTIVTLVGLLLIFLVIAGIFYFSYDLIVRGHSLEGSIFGSIDVGALLFLINKIRPTKNNH
ncbi:MAG: hypothetical protein E7081_02585 [Bacteroidales bacterium]|nr:hypothetical protein [Bacteroidales bacterium]